MSEPVRDQNISSTSNAPPAQTSVVQNGVKKEETAQKSNEFDDNPLQLVPDENGELDEASVEKLIECLNGCIEIGDLKMTDEELNVPPPIPDASKTGIDSVIHAILDALQESAAKKNKPANKNSAVIKEIEAEEPTKSVANSEQPMDSITITEEQWQSREKTLLDKIAKLEEQLGDDIKLKAVEIKLKLKCEENDILKSKLKTLETELRAVLSKPNAKNKDMVTKIKKQHEELLTKARGMIFDKTKMIKNQELQIEALTSQVTSLKEVVSCTKDLLNIRNMEVVHLQERLECMDLKIQAEKDRHNLMMKKMETGTKVNDDLKKEYLKQMELFKDLRLKYEEKFKMLEANQKETPSTSTENGVPSNEPQTAL